MSWSWGISSWGRKMGRHLCVLVIQEQSSSPLANNESFQRADTVICGSWQSRKELFCQALAQISASPRLAACLSPWRWVGEVPLCTTAVITAVSPGEGRLLLVPLATQPPSLVPVSPSHFGKYIYFFLPSFALRGCKQRFQGLSPLPSIQASHEAGSTCLLNRE